LLRETAEEIAGQRIETLHTDNLPGCRTMATGQQ